MCIRDSSKAGVLYPLNQCGLPTKDWLSETFRISEWALPFEADIQLLFYSKIILRKLGWSEERIQNFPEYTGNGTITLNDLLAISQEALDSDLVSKGFGFAIHDTRFQTIMHFYQQFDNSYSLNVPLVIDKESMSEALKLFKVAFDSNTSHRTFGQEEYSNISNRLSVRDAIAHGRILFSHSPTSEWTRMLLDHVSDEALLSHNIGIALFPPIKRNQPGTAILRSVGSYVIFNHYATNKHNQNVSCLVLNALKNTEIDRIHAFRTNQITPTNNTIWTPASIPEITIDTLRASGVARPAYEYYRKQIVDAVAQLSRKELSVEQAATFASREPIESERP